jgi:hypothetical protein
MVHLQCRQNSVCVGREACEKRRVDDECLTGALGLVG